MIFEVWTGEVHATDLAAYWKRYLADPGVLEIRRTIADLRAAVICFSGWELQSLIREIVLSTLKDRKWATAIVVSEPAQFGVSRQYQVFAEHCSKDSIFATAEEAEKWMSSGPCRVLDSLGLTAQATKTTREAYDQKT